MEINGRTIQLDEPQLEHIVDSLVRELNPHKLIIFGSRAQGTARDDSDVSMITLPSSVTTMKVLPKPVA